jgi:hypothetical protein
MKDGDPEENLVYAKRADFGFYIRGKFQQVINPTIIFVKNDILS